jgi:hypothetical protein
MAIPHCQKICHGGAIRSASHECNEKGQQIKSLQCDSASHVLPPFLTVTFCPSDHFGLCRTSQRMLKGNHGTEDQLS